MSKLTFNQLVQKEKTLRKVKHHDFDTQRIVADMLFILLDIPKWKVWAWYPIARYVDIMRRTHKNSCGLELD